METVSRPSKTATYRSGANRSSGRPKKTLGVGLYGTSESGAACPSDQAHLVSSECCSPFELATTSATAERPSAESARRESGRDDDSSAVRLVGRAGAGVAGGELGVVLDRRQGDQRVVDRVARDVQAREERVGQTARRLRSQQQQRRSEALGQQPRGIDGIEAEIVGQAGSAPSRSRRRARETDRPGQPSASLNSSVRTSPRLASARPWTAAAKSATS